MEQQFSPGDLIRIETLFQKKNSKEKATAFEGVVMGIRGRGENKSVTVRKIGAGGIGVERIFPLSSPHILKITVKRKGHVRQAKLGYLRARTSRNALLT